MKFLHFLEAVPYRNLFRLYQDGGRMEYESIILMVTEKCRGNSSPHGHGETSRKFDLSTKACTLIISVVRLDLVGYDLRTPTPAQGKDNFPLYLRICYVFSFFLYILIVLPEEEVVRCGSRRSTSFELYAIYFEGRGVIFCLRLLQI